MPRELSATDAAALFNPKDSMGFGLGASQPPELLTALGARDDWTDLTISGALLTVFSELFKHPGVLFKSGFLGPVERFLRDEGARIEFIPADFRRFAPLLAAEAPRVMSVVTAPPDENGWCSLSLHAGGTVGELHAAGADPDRLLIVETSERYPRTYGLEPGYPHALHLDQIDVLIAGAGEPIPLPVESPSETDRAIAGHADDYIPDGATLQTGIGSVPLAIAEHLANGPGGDYGIHSEMFTDGIMQLHKAGKVSNNKGFHDGVSIATFALGSRDLYDWLHENREIAFLPVEYVNDPHVMARNRNLVTINGALAVDIHGQVVADTRDGRQFSGIGGAEDFVSGPAYAPEGHSLLCMHATATVNGELVSRIVPQHPPGAVITTPRHQIDIVVTEFGAVELEGLSVRERGQALATIAHPDFRDAISGAADAYGSDGSTAPQIG
ncbi:MAG: acetyl-CoA hydrolase/transferase C-terminal domain-containing protein [Solirubrobacterales bacterium]